MIYSIESEEITYEVIDTPENFTGAASWCTYLNGVIFTGGLNEDNVYT